MNFKGITLNNLPQELLPDYHLAATYSSVAEKLHGINAALQVTYVKQAVRLAGSHLLRMHHTTQGIGYFYFAVTGKVAEV